jgi:hypothetical protein
MNVAAIALLVVLVAAVGGPAIIYFIHTTRNSSSMTMNDDKRIFALISLGLILLALLGPFPIAAQGFFGLAFGFGATAGSLALLFGVLGWSERIGRAVTIASVFVLVLVGGGYNVLKVKSAAEHAQATPATVVEVTPADPAGPK